MTNKKEASRSAYISCDRDLIQVDWVYSYLHENMYWAKSLTLEAFRRALDHSAVVFGVYHNGKQIGFARVISDCATFAYLTDVFIEESYRGQGLSTQLLQEIVSNEKLQGLRRFTLVTETAAGLYARFGFRPLEDAAHWMQIFAHN